MHIPMSTAELWCTTNLTVYLAEVFDHHTQQQTLTQTQFWDALRTNWIQHLPESLTESKRERLIEVGQAFADGLLHGFHQRGFLTSEYLVDGYWINLHTTPKAPTPGSRCRIVWKKTGALYGEV